MDEAFLHQVDHFLKNIYLGQRLNNFEIDEKFLNLEEIKKRVDKGYDIIGRNENFKPIPLDSKFPSYVLKNRLPF